MRIPALARGVRVRTMIPVGVRIVGVITGPSDVRAAVSDRAPDNEIFE